MTAPDASIPGPGPARRQWLEDTLRSALAPEHLTVEDESAQHAGHPGAAGGGGHFRALIVAAAFRGQSRLARQRAVYALLGDALHGPIHALALQTLTPEEWQARRAAGGAAPGA
jgi:BolA protein